MSLSPIIIGLSQYFSPTPPQIKREYWLSQNVSCIGIRLLGTVKASLPITHKSGIRISQ
jgi:hypothetical protein